MIFIDQIMNVLSHTVMNLCGTELQEIIVTGMRDFYKRQKSGKKR